MFTLVYCNISVGHSLFFHKDYASFAHFLQQGLQYDDIKMNLFNLVWSSVLLQQHIIILSFACFCILECIFSPQVRVAGHYVTVLLDPTAYDAVVSDTKALDLKRYAQVLMQRMFGLNLPNHDPASERAWMKQ